MIRLLTTYYRYSFSLAIIFGISYGVLSVSTDHFTMSHFLYLSVFLVISALLFCNCRLSLHLQKIVRALFLSSLLLLIVSTPLLLPPLWCIYTLFAITLISGILLTKSVATQTQNVTPTRSFGWLLIPILVAFAYVQYSNLEGIGFQMDEFYAASEIQTYADSGKLFYIGDTPYGRSELTTLFGMTSYVLLSQFVAADISPEFAFRASTVFFGLLSILITFFIVRKITQNSILGLAASSFIAVETYLFYFFAYFRFYAPAIFFTLLFLFLTLQYRNRFISLALAITSILLYSLLTEYFLITAAFFFSLYIYGFFSHRQSSTLIEKFLFVTSLTLATIGLTWWFSIKIDSQATYNLLALTLNTEGSRAMSNWLLINYAGLVVMASIAIFATLTKLISHKGTFSLHEHLLEYFVLYNVTILFVYIVHASFNFTFRVTLFFLPVLFILFFTYLPKLVGKWATGFLMVALLFSNLYITTTNFIDEPGDHYFPLKPVYEKIDIATGNKDIAKFFSDTIRPTQEQLVTIGYIGLGYDNLQYYLRGDLRPALSGDFRYRKVGNSTLENLEYFIHEHADTYIFFVINANALPTRENILYTTIWGKKHSTEVDPTLVTFIQKNPDFKKVYTSQDGYSSVYVRITEPTTSVTRPTPIQ
jgi:hypothetical protein